MSTRRFANGYAALQAFRPRWHIENDGYRELKEGFGLEEQRWGRDVAAARGRTTLTILAFNTAQAYRTRGDARLAKLGIRRLRRQSQPELGPSPVVIFLEDCYAVLARGIVERRRPPRATRTPASTRSRRSPLGPSEPLTPIVWLALEVLDDPRSQ